MSFGQVPFRALNQYGRLLDFKNGSKWVAIKPLELSSKKQQINLKLNDSNASITGRIINTVNGYHSLSKKEKYFSNPIAYKNNIADYQTDINIINHEVIIKEKNSNTFSENLEIEINDLELVGANYFINPFLSTFFDENPFKLQERTYPIDFGFPDSYIYSYKLSFDSKKYEVVEIPKTISQKLPNTSGTLVLSATKNNDNVMLFLKFNFKNAIYGPNFYPYLKEYFNKIITVQKNALIVLKKK